MEKILYKSSKNWKQRILDTDLWFIWYITPHIGADLPKKKYQSVWLAVPSDFISFTL